MSSLEDGTHSFIFKIWLEEHAEEGMDAIWRGLVTHVPSGARRHVKSLDEVITFIVPYIQKMGADPDVGRSAKGWMQRRRKSSK